MATRTIAIIGATGKMGSAIAKNLVNTSYRLLLLSDDTQKLEALIEEIKQLNPYVDADSSICPVDASWEADIIILAIPYESDKEIAQKISSVATGKIVVSVSNSGKPGKTNGTSRAEELQKQLPSSKVVRTFNSRMAMNPADGILNEKEIFIAGNDEEALQTITELIMEAGFRPVIAGDLTVSRTLEDMAVLLGRLNNNIQQQLSYQSKNFA